jgi:hypothetical protein
MSVGYAVETVGLEQPNRRASEDACSARGQSASTHGSRSDTMSVQDTQTSAGKLDRGWRFRPSSVQLLIDRVPDDRWRWGPSGDLTQTAKEIAEFITRSGSSEATIVASDEI